eukprot:9816350-Prorocentrum_lima.AAC.1
MTHLGMRFNRIENPRPTSVEGMVKALCKNVLGEDADVEACWSARSATKQVDIVLCKENLEAVQELLERDDAAEAEQ